MNDSNSMYANIMIALDLESESNVPLITGLRLASEHGATARVVSVVRTALLSGKGIFQRTNRRPQRSG